ncbi:MAG: hypothetical protein AB2L07_15860 [Thermoanaerobaculaceae bacterium]
MPGRRIEMRKVKEVLRLRLTAGLSSRQIALCTGVGKSVVSKHVARADEVGLDWSSVEAMDEETLEARLYPDTTQASPEGPVVPDWDEVARELRRKGVTKRLLWEEYQEQHRGRAYSYSRYFELYAGWKGCIEPVMRFEHPAGERCFVDYAGQTLEVVDPSTGEVRQAQVFVVVLGGEQLHLCRRHLEPAGRGLPGLAPAGRGGVRRRPADLRPGQPQVGRHDTRLVRAHGQSGGTRICWATWGPWPSPDGWAGRGTRPRWRTACCRSSAGCWRRCGIAH